MVPAATTPVDVPASRKFESLVKRTVLKQTNETQGHRIAVLVASAVFLPFIALADLVRYAGFKAGEKNGKVAKYFDGKSWSLIDKASIGCKVIATKTVELWNEFSAKARGLAGKASTKFKDLITKKNPTLDEKNEKSKKAIETGVAQLIKAYDEHNEADAFKGSTRRKVMNGQKALAEAVLRRLDDNATGSDDFVKKLNSAKALVADTVEQQAADKPYFVNKADQNSVAPLADIANHQFEEFFNDTQKNKVAVLFICKIAHESDYAKALSIGLAKGIITQELAVKALTDKASRLYRAALSSGIEAAETALEALLSKAVRQGIIDSTDAINKSVLISIDTLAQVAAESLYSVTDEATIHSEIAKLADLLAQKGRLTDEQKAEFSSKAKGLVHEEHERVRKEKEAEEARQAKEAADAAEKAALPGKFDQVLDAIAAEQQILDGKFAEFKKLDEKLAEISKEYATYNAQTVAITIEGKTRMLPGVEAVLKYIKASDKAGEPDASPAVVNARVQALQSNNASLLPFIPGLLALSEKRGVVTADRERLSAEIAALFNTVDAKRKVQVVSLYLAKRKGDIATALKAIEAKKKGVESKEQAQYDQLQKLLHVNFLKRLKPRDEVRVTAVTAAFDDLYNTANAVPAETTPSAPLQQSA